MDTAQSQTNASIFVCSLNFISEFDLSPGLHFVQVLAFKMLGKGVLSECVVTRTDEEGTQNDF